MRRESEVQATAAPAVDEFGKIEVYGIDIIPDEHRHGSPRELFWPWFGANSTFINMIAGGVLILYGLNLWQGLSIVVVGSLAYLIVGLCSPPGPRAGNATLIISRAPFGLRGNSIPTRILMGRHTRLGDGKHYHWHLRH